jgi:hypothetical protein
MRIHSVSLPALFAATTALLFAPPTPARAQVDSAGVPYFISQSFLGFDPEGDGTTTSPANDLYDSNAGPRSTFLNFSGNVDGAGVSANASSLYNGFFSARNAVSLTVSNVQDAASTLNALQGSHTSVQFFTPGALAERSVFTWRVTGTESATLGQTEGTLNFLAGRYGGQPFINALFLNSNPTMTWTGPGTYTYNLPLLLDQPIDLFYLSLARYRVSKAEAQTVLGGTYTGTSNYASTYELVGVALFDGSGNPINNWTMTDLSTGQTVFNQNGRVEGQAVIPEPGTLALLAPGLLPLVGMVRRRRRA